MIKRYLRIGRSFLQILMFLIRLGLLAGMVLFGRI